MGETSDRDPNADRPRLVLCAQSHAASRSARPACRPGGAACRGDPSAPDSLGRAGKSGGVAVPSGGVSPASPQRVCHVASGLCGSAVFFLWQDRRSAESVPPPQPARPTAGRSRKCLYGLEYLVDMTRHLHLPPLLAQHARCHRSERSSVRCPCISSRTCSSRPRHHRLRRSDPLHPTAA